MAKRRISEVRPVPAPVRGIDDASSLANMDPAFAISMINWYPKAGALEIRKGFREHATGMASAGKTLMSYIPPTGGADIEMFCCTDDGIYEVTNAGPVGAPVHPLTEGKVSWVQMSNIAGSFLVGCNGVDPAFIYNGTTWTNFTSSATPSAPGEVDGVAPTALKFVQIHHNRLWFLEVDTMSAWYLPINQLAGELTEFPMGGIFTKGGTLESIFSWTVDAGKGVNDVMVLQTSRGEIAGYEGIDPDTLGSFTLMARYYLGAPLGIDSVAHLNGDVLMLTEYGIVPLSGVVNGQYSLGSTDSVTSGRISRSLSSLIKERGLLIGWEMHASPSQQSLFLSIPADEAGDLAFQYVMNTLTGAWTSYDLPAKTFHEHMGILYFTDYDGNVQQYGTVSVDSVKLDGSGGQSIVAGFQQAYDYFGAPTTNKHYKLVKSIFESSSQPNYLVTISPDYSPGGLNLLGLPTLDATTVSQWNSAKWDEDRWSPGTLSWQEWIGVEGIGYSASLIIKVRASVPVDYVVTHWVYEQGNSL